MAVLTTPTIQDAKSIIIVGAGNFGATTALYLANACEGLTVILIDTTPEANPRAASHDINKIVRDDYADPLYMKMMLKAMPLWRDRDSMYGSYFHEVGMLRVDHGSHGEKVLRTYEALSAKTSAGWLSVEDVRSRFKGAFADSNFGDQTRVFYNPDCGWAEADKALNAVISKAKAAGVQYRQGRVQKVKLAQNGSCDGVILEGGEEVGADAVLLATGARTPALLFDSAPNKPDLHVGDRLVATGAMSFTGTLTDAKKEKYLNVPVCKNVLPNVKGGCNAVAEKCMRWPLTRCRGEHGNDAQWNCQVQLRYGFHQRRPRHRRTRQAVCGTRRFQVRNMVQGRLFDQIQGTGDEDDARAVWQGG